MSEWKTEPLIECASINKGEQINKDTLFNKGIYPVINGGIQPSGYCDFFNRNSNTITISEGGNSCGYVNWMNCDFWSGGHCYTLDKVEKIDVKYLYHLLKFRENDIMKLRVGSGLPNIQKKEIGSLFLTYPKRKQVQKEIAHILSTCDTVIEQTRSAIAKYKAIKQGLLHDLFTRGLDEHGNLRSEKTHKFKDSKLGRIPVEWDVNKLEDTCTHIVDCPHSTPNYLDHGVLVARTFSIKDGIYDLDNSSFISEEEYNERIQRLEPKSGDIIFTREAPVGEAFVIPENMRICLGQRVMLLRMNSQNNPNYLLEVLYSKSTKLRFDNLVSGTTNPHLNVGDVKKFEFVFPKLEEQNKIVKRLSSLNNKIQTEEILLQKYQSIKRGLMGDLLGGRKEVTN